MMMRIIGILVLAIVLGLLYSFVNPTTSSSSPAKASQQKQQNNPVQDALKGFK